MEWFVFSGPIHDTFLSQIICTNNNWSLQPDTHSDDPRKVFDLVGYAEKGLKTRTVKGANREHKGWHDSLCAAEEGKKSLNLTWRGFGNELRAEDERRRKKEMVEMREEQGQDENGDVSMNEEAMPPPQPPQKPVVRRKAVR